ncbi:MAG: DUF58 domain-containing protein [Candidatus Omnitrophica bacterium]|nr:DUF58 domain-containing protein [Candidatus Omnitrophota bacterium]
MRILPLDPALLSRLEALRLSVRSVRWGSRLGGRFTVNRRGSSIEFADYAVYTPGDEIQAIDWSLYARLDRLFVKTYKEDVELGVDVVIDATASMGLPSTEKFLRACRLALCLGYIAVAGGHHVRMSFIRSGPIRPSSRMIRRAELSRLVEWLRPASPEGSVALSAWARQAITTLRLRGGQLLVISDWMHRQADCFQALRALRAKHLEMKLIQLLSPDELNPGRMMRGGFVVDGETGQTRELAYSPAELARAVAEHTEQLARFCRRNGILFAQHRLDESLDAFLFARLPKSGFIE